MATHFRKLSRPIAHTIAGVIDRTVAARGEEWISASSPKLPPAPTGIQENHMCDVIVFVDDFTEVKDDLALYGDDELPFLYNVKIVALLTLYDDLLVRVECHPLDAVDELLFRIALEVRKQSVLLQEPAEEDELLWSFV